ncbi:MAG: restriction endonuclease subunit S [Paludibacteraceae bacterium]|nr:restriction endonuclease subunit S [Paludibacteraceae bacterium]
MVKLSEIVTDIYRGSGLNRDDIVDDGNPCVRYGEIYTTYNIYFDKCVSHTYKGIKKFEYGDILFAITGETVEDIAKSCAYIGHETCFAGGDIVVMKHKQNPKYISYALSTSNAQAQKSKGKVKSKVVHSSIPSIKEIQIPLPSLDAQTYIVSILDRFYEIINDLTSGLPAEIEARRKQYEYYRDRLLSFPEAPS